MKYIVYRCELGDLTVLLNNGAIKKVEFGQKIENIEMNDDPVIGIEIMTELDNYFSGLIKNLNLPISPDGTEFQNDVWQKLREIPYGETKTYLQIAKELGKPNSARAVGGACNRNPVPIIIPCHRVVGSDGKLTGYAGGLEYKKKLLELEKKYS